MVSHVVLLSFGNTSKISLFFFSSFIHDESEENSRLLVFHFSQHSNYYIHCVVLLIMFPARGQSDIKEKKNVVFVVLLKL